MRFEQNMRIERDQGLLLPSLVKSPNHVSVGDFVNFFT